MSPFYSSVKQWILSQVANQGSNRALVIGVSAPQGAGKTTLTSAMVEALGTEGYSAIAVSIDDFYLTRELQLKLAAANRDNPCLQQRGYPGTHDLKFGVEVLNALKNLGRGETLVPRYDKSAHQGAGDRAPKSLWHKVSGPLNVILFEGWMLGFDVPEYRAWWKFLDSILYLRARDYHYVLDWRVEAEQKMRATGKTGMTDQQVQEYAQKFMPAYEKWQETVVQTAKNLMLFPDRYLEIEIEKNREPTP